MIFLKNHYDVSHKSTLYHKLPDRCAAFTGCWSRRCWVVDGDGRRRCSGYRPWCSGPGLACWLQSGRAPEECFAVGSTEDTSYCVFHISLLKAFWRLLFLLHLISSWNSHDIVQRFFSYETVGSDKKCKIYLWTPNVKITHFWQPYV